MRVFGIDCGTECTGYGVVETDDRGRGSRLEFVAAGTVRIARAQSIGDKLAHVFGELTTLIELHRPDAIAIEEVFFAANAKSALKLGQVRGVALLAASLERKPVAEYAPLSIKSAVVGYGLAAKEQVQFMVARLLRLENHFDSPDAADALAVAICHLHTALHAGAGQLKPPAVRRSAQTQPGLAR